MATTFTIDANKSSGQQYPPTGPQKTIVGTLVTDGNDGGAVGDILATLFGLTTISRADPLVKSTDDLIVVVAPVTAGTSLVGKAAATAALADIPVGTYTARIIGY